MTELFVALNIFLIAHFLREFMHVTIGPVVSSPVLKILNVGGI